MKKIIVSLVALVVILFFYSCERNVFAPDGDGVTRFQFEDLRFEYNWSTGVMSGVNPSSSGGEFIFIINDRNVNARAGNRLRLGPYGQDSFTRFYNRGVNLLVEYHWDGVAGYFYITLK